MSTASVLTSHLICQKYPHLVIERENVFCLDYQNEVGRSSPFLCHTLQVIPAPPAIEMAKRLSLPTRRPSSLNGTNSAPGQTLPISSSAPAAVPASSSQPSGPGGSGGDGGGGSGGGSDSSGGDGGGGGSKGVNELDFQNILDRAASMLAAETRSRAGASAVSAGALPTGTSSESPGGCRCCHCCFRRV